MSQVPSSSFINLYKIARNELNVHQLDKESLKIILRQYRRARHTKILYVNFINITDLNLSNTHHQVDYKHVSFSVFKLIKNLKNVDLSHNTFTRIPVFENKTIISLDMSFNQIVDVSSSSFDYVFYSCQPKFLNLSNNKLTKFVCNSVHFKKLYLNNNKIEILIANYSFISMK